MANQVLNLSWQFSFKISVSNLILARDAIIVYKFDGLLFGKYVRQLYAREEVHSLIIVVLATHAADNYIFLIRRILITN